MFYAFYIYSKITQGSNNLSNIFYLLTYVQLFFLIVNLIHFIDYIYIYINYLLLIILMTLVISH